MTEYIENPLSGKLRGVTYEDGKRIDVHIRDTDDVVKVFVPVRHGRWVDKGEYAVCTECGGRSGTQYDGVEPIPLMTQFCPNCGCLQKENRKIPHRKTQYRVDGDIAYIKTYDGVEFFVNSCDLDLVLQHRWHANGSGHVATEYGIPIHRLLMNSPKNMDVHHINGNKLDNRRINLIMMTRSEHTSLHMRMRYAKQPPKGE